MHLAQVYRQSIMSIVANTSPYTVMEAQKLELPKYITYMEGRQLQHPKNVDRREYQSLDDCSSEERAHFQYISHNLGILDRSLVQK